MVNSGYWTLAGQMWAAPLWWPHSASRDSLIELPLVNSPTQREAGQDSKNLSNDFLKSVMFVYPLNLEWDNSDKEAQAPGGAALEEHHERGETARGVTSVLSPISLGKMRFKRKMNQKLLILLLWFLNMIIMKMKKIWWSQLIIVY